MKEPRAGDLPFGPRLAEILSSHEEWLMRRVLSYAKRQEYTRYTSTLVEAWRLSISGLSSSILAALRQYSSVPEFSPHEDTTNDPVAEFGVLEAKRHRSRGVSLFMFLGLYKYYEQAYVELLEHVMPDGAERAECERFVRRVFDRIEIAFSVEWARTPTEHLLLELQDKNRSVTNEKNAFLTVFESLHTPILLLDAEGRVTNLNHQATQLIDRSMAPGAGYYSEDTSGVRSPSWPPRGVKVRDLFPWLPPSAVPVGHAGATDVFECTRAEGGSTRIFEGRVSPLLDVSEKQVGVAIVLNDITEHKALAARLDYLARTDDLTQVNNRRRFFELARQETQRARRYQRDLSLLIIDVDHFKNINDSHGHGAGDEILVGISRTMLDTLRCTDTLGRVGGEEFAIVLPETGADSAQLAGERLRSRIAERSLVTSAGELSVTVSVGAATLSPSDRDFDALLRRADQALYLAKSAGRDRVVSVGTGHDPAAAPAPQSKPFPRAEPQRESATIAADEAHDAMAAASFR
ncbi:MAG: diguanylate cyclase [Polyangiaceae bacterium]|nr:diguanylate cyclase [Polyangiaceae bacterium]